MKTRMKRKGLTISLSASTIIIIEDEDEVIIGSVFSIFRNFCEKKYKSLSLFKLVLLLFYVFYFVITHSICCFFFFFFFFLFLVSFFFGFILTFLFSAIFLSKLINCTFHSYLPLHLFTLCLMKCSH